MLYDNIRAMRKLSYQNRLTVRTAPELLEALGVLRARLQSRGVEFRARKIGLEGIAGAFLLAALDRPLQEQVEVVEKWLARLEAMLADSPVPEEPPGPAASPAAALGYKIPAGSKEMPLTEASPRKPKGRKSKG
jgi:hypothetical protein